jgi:uncharacterized damage-inducible protein DinB
MDIESSVAPRYALSSMRYETIAIPARDVPRAAFPLFQHLLDTYASEINKVYSTWSLLEDADLDYRPHARSSSVAEILQHQILSERRFFAEFLNVPEPPATDLIPHQQSVPVYAARLVELALPRLAFLSDKDSTWWMTQARFFDVDRERIWIFWRRVLHTAHHRTQLTVYIRLLERPVPATYGPTADVTWSGADPTLTVEAASRPGATESCSESGRESSARPTTPPD